MAGSTPGYTMAARGAQGLPYLGIAVLADGSLAVAEPGDYRIRRITLEHGGKAAK